MPKQYFTSPEKPSADRYQEALDAIFSASELEERYDAEPKIIDGAKVMVAYQTDDDAYAGWMSGNHYSGITYDPVHGVFLEEYYPNANPPYIMRYRAPEPHTLTEITIIRDGVPEMLPVDTARERHYRHGLNDISVANFRTALTGNHALQKCVDYRKLTGSKAIAEFMDRLLRAGATNE